MHVRDTRNSPHLHAHAYLYMLQPVNQIWSGVSLGSPSKFNQKMDNIPSTSSNISGDMNKVITINRSMLHV